MNLLEFGGASNGAANGGQFDRARSPAWHGASGAPPLSVIGWLIVVLSSLSVAFFALWQVLLGRGAAARAAAAPPHLEGVPLRFYPASQATPQATLRAANIPGNDVSARPSGSTVLDSAPTLVIFFTSDAGWLGLNTKLPKTLSHLGYPTVSWNSLRYYVRRRTPEEAAAHLAEVVEEYTGRCGAPDVALVGYSWGAGVLPFLARRLPAELKARLCAAVYLAYPGFGAFHFKPSAWWLEIGDEALPAREEVAAMPEVNSICIAGEGDPIRDCRSIESLGVPRELFPAGHTLNKVLSELLPHIVKTIETGRQRLRDDQA